MFSDLVDNLKEGALLGTGALQSICDRLLSLIETRPPEILICARILELLGLMPE
jgi:hypothetical protein